MDEHIIEEVVEEVEELFKPKPGGIVDTYRKHKAQREEAERERENQDERIEEAGYKAVKVTPLSPEIFIPLTYTIQPGGAAPVLPLSMTRYRAVVMVITTNATVILCKDSNTATGGIGFTLPYGIPIVLLNRAQLYAVNNTAAPVQVSVISELYAADRT